MSCWNIINGLLQLSCQDNSLYYPDATAVLTQKDSDSFVYGGHNYDPLSSINLRISEICVHPIVSIKYANCISLTMHVVRKGVRVILPLLNERFVDYMIQDCVWRACDTTVETINNILSRYNVNPSDISFSQYIEIKKEIELAGVDICDEVNTLISSIRSSESYGNPRGLQANLYPYQSSGAKWLDFMSSHRCGCILGDEMGLGKTLQIITLMGALKERKHNVHFLVICPVSLLENWRREIAKFYPSLKSHIHYGPRRTGDPNVPLYSDVVIMPYSCAISDSGLLTMIKWDILILDEAQNIKNPDARRTKAVKRIPCEVPIAVSGTPFENHMTDIWSLVDFILPGFLGTRHQFDSLYSDDLDSAVKLEKTISPLILRRLVKDVAKDLPERVDIPIPVIMSDDEARLYEDCRLSENPHEELKDLKIDTIQKLRTFCTHPCVYNPDHIGTDPTKISTKYERLVDILQEIFENGEKAVVFTSFKRMTDVLINDIKNRFNVYTDCIDGSIPAKDRQSIVDKFTDHTGPGMLVLNPKAAGTGLNITCANHAIHYNLEWNPAVEDQASARIYRRGQNKTVFIYRLYYIDTIEEIINDRIQNKRQLSDTAIVGNLGQNTEKEYLLKALAATPYKK